MKLYMTRSISTITLLTMFIVVTGCNNDSDSETSTGGGSSVTIPDAGSAAEVPAASEPVSSLAGTYIGTATVTATASPPINLSQTETVPVTVTIDQNGSVTIQSGSDLFPDVITLNGNSFSYSRTFNNESFGSVTCSGTLTLQGSIENNTRLTATLNSQSVSCNGVSGTVTGSMNANKQ